MKILLINGSPKLEKSDTLHITNAFIKGIESVNDVEVETVNTISCNIGYCKGCLNCMRNGGECVINDDMRGILEKILDSDLLLFSFPLYCYAMPASLKALIDRTLPLSSLAMRKVDDRYGHVPTRDFSRLRYVMISGCGFPNSKNNFEGLIEQFRLMFGDDSEIITVTEAPMFNSDEAKSVTEPFLKKVFYAGVEYAKLGRVSEKMKSALKEPMIPDEVYAEIVNKSI